ncbi:MAG: type II secretion system protein [Thermodesulfovibrionia bacterium]|nr:type II secretion system protein [Thermodesulfovibrionia bacterium]
MNNKKVRCFKSHNVQYAHCTSRSGGFTLIEVIVAITILSISLVMVMQLFSGGLRASRASCDYTRAVVHAKDKMEELSVEPVQDSGEFEDGFTWESDVQPYEELNKELEESDYNMLIIKVKVSWSNRAHKQKSVELVSLKAVEKEEA